MGCKTCVSNMLFDTSLVEEALIFFFEVCSVAVYAGDVYDRVVKGKKVKELLEMFE